MAQIMLRLEDMIDFICLSKSRLGIKRELNCIGECSGMYRVTSQMQIRFCSVWYVY